MKNTNSDIKKNKRILLSQYIKNNLNAGPKAKVDIENILYSKYGFKVNTMYLTDEIYQNKIKRKIRFLKKFIIVTLKCWNADIIVVQVPFSNRISTLNKNKNKVAIIHDIEGLRNEDENELTRELNFYKTCMGLIVHNEKMKEFLVDKGIDISKIYVLEIFDYLCKFETNPRKEKEKNKIPTIVYTGNMDKAPFIHQLEKEKMNFRLNIYGILNSEIKNENIEYKGKYLPDELPKYIEGDIGLVWDGNFDESDENEGYKKYTKYNTPHKVSCYIATGLPVIVWKKSAIADFVKKNNIGYTISNLYDINKIDYSDYDEKLRNVEKIGERVKNGYYTKRAMDRVFEILKKNNND